MIKMAKTKAELQDELIGLRNENKRAKVRLERLNSDLNYVNARNTEVEEKNKKLIEAMDRMNDDWGKKYIKAGEQKHEISNKLERLQAAHIKLGDKWREEIKTSTEMTKQRDLRDASIGELRKAKYKLNQELEHFKERNNYHYLLHQQTADKLGTIKARLDVSLFREKENQRTIERLETLYEYALIDVNRIKDESRELTMKLIESNEKLEALEGKK